jgi:hypothetical protein
MKFYLGWVRVPTVVARHAPVSWVRYSLSAAEVARINREAARRADELRDLWD